MTTDKAILTLLLRGVFTFSSFGRRRLFHRSPINSILCLSGFCQFFRSLEKLILYLFVLSLQFLIHRLFFLHRFRISIGLFIQLFTISSFFLSLFNFCLDFFLILILFLFLLFLFLFCNFFLAFSFFFFSGKQLLFKSFCSFLLLLSSLLYLFLLLF